MSDDDKRDDLGNRIAQAIAGRRPEPARGFEERLRAAALRPTRLRWFAPAIAATAVAVMALAVAFVWRGRSDDDGRLEALARIEPAPPAPPAPTPAKVDDPPPVTTPPLPAGPLVEPGALQSGTPELLRDFQSVLDGDLSGLGLDAAQTTKIKRIIDDYKRVLILHLGEQVSATSDMQAQNVRADPDTGLMLAAFDRGMAAESAARRATMVARIAIRDALRPAQRVAVEKRPSAPVVSSVPPPPPSAPAAPAKTPLAKIRIMTQPPAAEVVLDGAKLGVTPLVATVAHGRHGLRISVPGYMVIDRNLDITGDTTLRLVLDPSSTGTGTLRINATPYAEISVDGVLVGTTPLITKVATGRRRISAEMSDGSKEIRIVTITDGNTTTLSFKGRTAPPAPTDELKDPFARQR